MNEKSSTDPRWLYGFCVRPDEKVEGPVLLNPGPQRDNRGLLREENDIPEGEG